MQQLERYSFICPEHILFAYDAPDVGNDTLYPAFSEIKRQIEQSGVVMADSKNENDIVSFARH